ncbi:DNA-binding protein [Candidatus Aerophobetes bacterium]|uniref:DNA-binding protein n=1 Tax=Aerophobetes bacterium TaxID=2030807 RepID=A0A523S318_UNCAE|nr:MAG: DNA-binding protein [Candidatus Aerophobetes bacterium]
MEWFKGGKVEDVIALRLDYGDDIHRSVERFCKDEEIHTGVIVSGIGTLYKARLHSIIATDFPGRDEILEMEGPIEISGIHGIVADYKPHMHFTIYNHDTGQVMAGHLEPGCLVLYLAELCLLKVSNLPLARFHDREKNFLKLGRR